MTVYYAQDKKWVFSFALKEESELKTPCLAVCCRQMILTGCVVYAEHVGAERLVEELLPQCWEQVIAPG